MDHTKKKVNFLKSVFQEKCPNCGEGNVFKKGLGIFKIPVMHENCSKCDYRFEREPGYFIGAMYLSYALAIFQGIISFLICSAISAELSAEWMLVVSISPMLLLAKQNFKWSRIIYIHIFPW